MAGHSPLDGGRVFRVEIALSAHIKINGFQNEGNKARENRSRIFLTGFFFFRKC